MLRAGFVLVFGLLMLATAAAAERVALIIGNGGYAELPRLINPVHDAEDLSDLLRKAGFEVLTGIDLDRAGMDAKAREFAALAKNAEIVLFYYAGHSVSSGGDDILIPVDAKLATAEDVMSSGIAAGVILKPAMAKRRVTIALLDVARTNPFGPELDKLAKNYGDVFQNRDVMTVHATGPGETAADGVGRNSPFMVSLLKHLTEKGVDLEQAMTKSLRKEVAEATDNRQFPWVRSSLTQKVYLGGQ